MDIDEIYKELDTLFKENKINEVEPFLLNYLDKAKETENYGIYISICNELMGFYRSISEYRKAFDISEDVLLLMEELQLENSEHFATTMLNAATVYRAAGQNDVAYTYYQRALKIYESLLEPNDYRFAGLYNNMSILLEVQDKNEEAAAFLEKAMAIIEGLDKNSMEMATSLTNLALIYFKQHKIEEVKEKLELALAIFENRDANTDAHYSAALAGIGEAYYHMKEYDKSLAAYEKSLEEIKKHFGMNDSYTLVASNCAAIAEEMGDKEKAAYYHKLSQK
ncbi:MAG: tetratricopeptide repeat protein [Lachnospiraceae bacterium]|nr:tetratricopeptide repeat protein [Lachnospiraceae bacterium]